MKMVKRYAGILMMLTLLVGFTSCEDDEDLEEQMFGRIWAGDVGMSAANGIYIVSLLLTRMALVKNINIIVTVNHTIIFVFSGIGRIVTVITLFWIMVEMESPTWMM